MILKHFKSIATFSEKSIPKIENDTIKGIVIVQSGVDKCGGYFDKEFIDALIQDGNSQTQGVKCRFGHPNMCKSSLGTFIGRYKNFYSVEEDGVYKAVADLTLAEISKTTQVEGLGISYFDYIIQMTKENPDMFGNSIVFSSNCEYPEMEIGGESFTVEKYTVPMSLIASDLVDSPAATDNLFKSSDDLGVTVSNFLDEHPEIFEIVQKDEGIIKNFLKRYEQFKSKNKNMNLLNKLLKRQKDITQTLGNGDVVTVITDEQEAKVGDKVVDADGQPLVDGEYVLPDNTKWEIVDGAITEINIEDEDQSMGTQLTVEEKESIKKMGAFMKNFETTFSKFMKETNSNFEGVASAILDIQEKQTKLAKTVKSDFKGPKAEEKEIVKNSDKTFMDLVNEQKEARESNKEK